MGGSIPSLYWEDTIPISNNHIPAPCRWPLEKMTKAPKKQINGSSHQSVMAREVVEALAVRPGGLYLDATFGGGGHSRAILQSSAPDGKVVALDRDPSVWPFVEVLGHEFPGRLQFFPLAYTELDKIEQVLDGAVFDLGLSSDQLAMAERGFSFSRPGILDMRFDPRGGRSARDLLRQASVMELERIFRQYGEDRQARGLARKIVERRRQQPITTVEELVAVVGTANPTVLAPIFQALRIAVNDELNVLSQGLEEVAGKLKVGGRLVVISFHSLEDRIVKNFLRNQRWQLVNKKPLLASEEEITKNSRSRSAKLRAAIKKED